jgi:hypothetical protein
MTSAVGAGPMNPLQAVLVGGARVFTADAVSGMSKAEAVRVMQRYESSLRNSSQQVVPTQPDATKPRSYGVDGMDATTAAGAGGAGGLSGGRGAGGGVPWSRLVGGGAQPGPGGSVGAGPVQSVLAAERAALADVAAMRAAGGGGYLPPMAPRSAEDDRDKAHQNRLPNVDNGLFALDQRPSAPVIGDLTDREHNLGF